MVKITGIFSRFHPIKALVIGDYMLDQYTTGQVKRISPEAPVVVLHVKKESSQPGGAGNVVLNTLSLGAKVAAIGRVGQDQNGKSLCSSLEKEGADILSFVVEKDYTTPVKNRFVGDGQQILRVDFENLSFLPLDLEQNIIDKLPLLLQDVQIIAISDYGKGFLSDRLLEQVIFQAKAFKIPVIVDPKGLDFLKYKGATVLKPNLFEAYAAAKLPLSESLEKVADKLLTESEVDYLLITRSEAGMSLFDQKRKRTDFPVRSKEVKDVTGAGDTVLAMIAVALGNGIDIYQASQLANIAAGIAIEHLGCARITLSDLAIRLLQIHVDNKVFDENHLYALKKVLEGKKISILGIETTNCITTSLYKTIRELSLRKDFELIIYVKDNFFEKEFISLLSSLSEVNFIILQSQSLKNLCEAISPDEVFVMRGNEAIKLCHPEALLEDLSALT